MAEIEKTDSTATSSKLKQLASSDTWTSPFRTSGGRKNTIKDFKDSNSLSQVKVPKKYSQHQILEEEKAKKAAAEKEAAEKAKKEAEDAENAAKSEPVDANGVKHTTGTEETNTEAVADAEVEAGPEETERPLTESEKVETEETEPNGKTELDDTTVTEDKQVTEDSTGAKDDNVEEMVKETPIEIVTQPEAKFEPVEMPNQAVLDSLQAKPNLLNRYQELNEAAIGSVSRSLDDPNKLIDLGSGLKLTQQQLLDIAAKRVAPVIANINEEVEKSRQEDLIVEKRGLDSKVALHQGKLDKDLEKHKGKLSKIRAKFDQEIAAKLTSLTNMMTLSTTAAREFETNTKAEIETAKTEYQERETKAVEKHEVDKETLVKNHEELTTTKKQALEDAKTGQETATTAIEELQEKKVQLDNDNSGLSTEIDELTEQLNERTKELDSLKEKLQAEKDQIAANESTKEELNTAIVNTKKGVEDKKASHAALAAQVGILGAAAAAYTAKLTSLRADKDARPSRLAQAKEINTTWQKDKAELAEKTAREHEQQRLEAAEAAETERVKREIEEEKQKLEDEKKQYEEERVRLEQEAQERREEEERKRKEEEETFIAEEQQRKEEYQKKMEEEEKKREEERLKREEEAAAAEAAFKAEEEEKEAMRKAEEEEKEKARLEEIRLANDPEHQRMLRIQKRDADRQKLLDEQAEKDRIYNERKQKEQDEFETLQEEIEQLKQQRDARALAEREEAERLAQAKLDEIANLKEEHTAKLALYKQRLEFEALQKERLEEEVLNLRKIRELREEKSRLATQVNPDSGMDSLQKLIEEREMEVTRLTKQIEFDDDDFYTAMHQSSARPMNAPIESKSAQPVAKAVELVKPTASKSESTSTGLLAGAVAGAAIGAAAIAGAASTGVAKGAEAATSVGAITTKAVTPSTPAVPKPSSSTVPSSGSTSTSRDRASSLSRTKSLSNKLKGILGRSKEEKEAKAKEANAKEAKAKTATKSALPAAAATTNVKSVDVSKQPDGQVKAPLAETETPVTKTEVPVAETPAHDDVVSHASSEWLSAYEEVSDEEFEKNKDDPNYIEVGEDEAEKYLNKNKAPA